MGKWDKKLIFLTINTQGLLNRKNLIPPVKYREGSVMMRGRVSSKGPKNFVRMHDIMDSSVQDNFKWKSGCIVQEVTIGLWIF